MKTLVMLVAMVSGCASVVAEKGPPKWQKTVIARGVELHVSDDAGAEAVAIAERIQNEYRATYIGARP
jgi:hypothetical protein